MPKALDVALAFKWEEMLRDGIPMGVFLEGHRELLGEVLSVSALQKVIANLKNLIAVAPEVSLIQESGMCGEALVGNAAPMISQELMVIFTDKSITDFFATKACVGMQTINELL